MNDNTNTGGSFRAKKNPFTQVSNSALRDNRLSLKAKGLYSLIQSYVSIPDFTLYKGHLMSICKEKEKAFDSAWKELKVNGYLKQYRIPKGKNDAFVYEYDLLDVADLTTPPLINLNKNGEEIKSSDDNTDPKDEISHTPHLAPYANGTLCEGHPVPLAPCAKRGGNNNTYINNTYINNTEDNYIDSSHMSKSDSPERKIPPDEKDDMTMTDDITTHQNFSEIKKEPSLNPAPASNGLLESSHKNNLSDYKTYLQIIQENIEYNNYLHSNRGDLELIDELLSCMLDVICTEGDTVRINGEDKNRDMVISQYLKINSADIEHILDRYKSVHHKITHLHHYLKTMLYTVKQENGHFYTNAVRTDGAVW